MDNAFWYVLHCKPRKESQVYGYLQGQRTDHDLEIYYPTIKVKPANPRAAKIRPYFPRYLFVRADLERVGVRTLQWTPGSTGLVRFGGEPATVPESFISALRQHIAEAQAARDPSLGDLRPGDTVRITSGAFAGAEAVFDTRLNGEARAQVLLDWLGRRLRVAVDARALERPPRRRRR